jgi:hypothetical protein
MVSLEKILNQKVDRIKFAEKMKTHLLEII